MNFLHKENPDRWHQLAWWLCVITLPLHATATNTSVILLAILWAADGNFIMKWQKLKTATWTLPFLIYYLVLLIGMFYTNDVDNGFAMLDKKILFIAFPILFATGRVVSVDIFPFLKRSFVYSCSAVVLICLTFATYSLFQGSATENFDLRTSDHFKFLHPKVSTAWSYFSYIQLARGVDIHPGYLSMYLVFCLIILFTEHYQTKKDLIIHGTLGLLIVCALPLLASRTATLAFFCSVAYIIAKQHKKQFKIYIPIIFASALLGLLLWLIPIARFRMIEEPLTTRYKADTTVVDWNSVSYRLLEWQGSWSIIKTNWLAGVGTGGNEKAMISFFNDYNSSTKGLDHNAHNEYIQVWAESGLPGFFTFFLCLTIGLSSMRNNSSYISFIIIFSLMCLTESIGERQKGVAFFCLFQALFLSAERKKI